jgi:hypothetical protein
MNAQRVRWTALGLALAGAVSIRVAAQTTSTTPAVQSFSIENTVSLDDIGATTTAQFNPAVLTAIQGGALQLRQSVRFDPAAMTLTVNQFTTQPGAPLPTPSTASLGNDLLSTYVIRVDRIYTATTPSPSVMFVGTVTANSPQSPHGNLTGAPAAVSVGYTTATPQTLNNAVALIAGRVVTFSGATTGTLTFPQTPGTGGPTTPPAGAPSVIVRPVADTNYPIIRLDASQTTNPGGGTLTYSWRVVSGAASISAPTAASTDAYLLGSQGEYTFEVTVTNATGQSTSSRITVRKLL